MGIVGRIDPEEELCQDIKRLSMDMNVGVVEAGIQGINVYESCQ